MRETLQFAERYCLPIMFSIVNRVVVFDLLFAAAGTVGVSTPSNSCNPLNASHAGCSAARLGGGGGKALGECKSSWRRALSVVLCAVRLEHGLSAELKAVASLASLLPLGKRCELRDSFVLKRLLKPKDTERYCRWSSVIRSE